MRHTCTEWLVMDMRRIRLLPPRVAAVSPHPDHVCVQPPQTSSKERTPSDATVPHLL
jgi:hypothetical protein